MGRPGGIRGRIVLLVTLGVLLPLAVAALVAGSRHKSLQRELEAQRGLLARALADRVETA